MRVDVARVLRNARDLMNTNGRHWIQGDMKIQVNERILNTPGNIRFSPEAEIGDVTFCAWGGIREVADDDELRIEAMEALVKIINPERLESYNEYQKSLLTDYEMECSLYSDFVLDYPTFAHYAAESLEDREDALGEIIATWNDDDKRTWDEVRASLTKAAAKAKARKS